MENNENKHKGFIFVRHAKESGKMFLSGNLTLASDMKAGDKIELIAHKANKKTKDGDSFFYMFERDEYDAEKGDAKKKVNMKKAENTADPF